VGEDRINALRVDSDRELRLEFHGARCARRWWRSGRRSSATPGPWSSNWPKWLCPGCCLRPSWGGLPDCGKHLRDRQ